MADVFLRGNSPSTMTAGIMLLTRARQLGYPISVTIVGDESDVAPVCGPAVLYAPVLASCGVGRDHGTGATVIVPGPPGQPLMVTATPHGIDGWFFADRTGAGEHPATSALLRMSADPRPPARQAARQLRLALGALGMTAEPVVLDILFGAHTPPLLRISLALRAGRVFATGRGEPITRYLVGSQPSSHDPLEPDLPGKLVIEMIEAGRLRWILDRLNPSIRDAVEDWVDAVLALARDDAERDIALLVALVELASHLVQLPSPSILPPLGAAEDSVAVGIASALRAEGDGDANAQLQQVYRFLGGRFAPSADFAFEVSTRPPPDVTDRIEIWKWFCAEVRVGRKESDLLFERVFHPTD